MITRSSIHMSTKKNERINNFAITLSTINGSGSATANMTLTRALFLMGIPVSGKNIFPSNIQGLSTWYTIRCNPDGFLGRVENDDIVVTMNPGTVYEDMMHVVPGGVLLYADDLELPSFREDIGYYRMPVKNIVQKTDVPPHLKAYIANMVYVGVLAELLGIDQKMILSALEYHFGSRTKPIESNFSVIQSAAEWANENIKKMDPYLVKSMNGNTGKIMTNGNTAAALGAIYGGVQFVSWYPITPASSIPEELNSYLPALRKDKATGKDTFVVVQAEDEIAAAGMITGAGWAGLRAMTATSGPGLSLMAEYLGLAYYSEIPMVVWDVQRVGPSTGLPTRTSQGDLTFAYSISHGDTDFIILIPGNMEECFEYGWRSFDIAEKYQTPVLVLSDLDLGMNHWLSDGFKYPNKPIDRGKVLWEEDLERWLKNHDSEWGRYLDIDGDGIPYRTLPGNKHPKAAYFSRGTGHDEFGNYSEDPEKWEQLLNRIKKKFLTALSEKMLPEPVIDLQSNAEIGIIAMGSTDLAIQEARSILSARGISSDYCRIRSFPIIQELRDFIESHSTNYVIELNRDGQLLQLISLRFPDSCMKLVSLSHIDGLPLTSDWVMKAFLPFEEA